jgi:hypothetical protein
LKETKLDERIISKCTLKKYDVRIWAGWNLEEYAIVNLLK